MAWIKQRTAEYRMTNNEFRMMESLAQRRRLRRVSLHLIIKKDRKHFFVIRYSLFQSFFSD